MIAKFRILLTVLIMWAGPAEWGGFIGFGTDIFVELIMASVKSGVFIRQP